VNGMEEGRKRVLGIMASILVARHLKTTMDFPSRNPKIGAVRRSPLFRPVVVRRTTGHPTERLKIRPPDSR